MRSDIDSSAFLDLASKTHAPDPPGFYHGLLAQTVGDLGSLLYPPRCQACAAVADEGAWRPDLCLRCGREVEELLVWDGPVIVPRGLDRAHAYVRFEGPMRRLLHGIKYAGAVRAGVRTGRRMGAAPGVDRLLLGSDLVVPVPLHWWRRWRRGHNQAETLVRGLLGPGRRRRRAGRPRSLRALRRRRATRPQVGLSRSSRAHNVAGVFRVRNRARRWVRDRSVLLVDDVVTTGATAVAAATALRRAGAAEVGLLAAAWATHV